MIDDNKKRKKAATYLEYLVSRTKIVISMRVVCRNESVRLLCCIFS